MKVHIIPKYESTFELAEIVAGIEGSNSKTALTNDFSLISCDVKQVDESAFDDFKYNLRQKIRGKAYAMTITAPKEIDAYLRELNEAKKAPVESVIEHNDTIDRVLLLEEPVGIIKGDMSYIMLTRNGGNKKQNAYMFQKINPKAVSSQHKHAPSPESPNATPKVEYHIGLFGESEEMSDNGLLKIAVGTVSAKLLGIAHMIRNIDEYIAARNLVVMAPIGTGRDDRTETDHLKWPD